MGDSLYVASSGAAARLKQLDMVANNLANSDTIGFRADRVLFESALDIAYTDDQGRPVPGASPLTQVQTSGHVTTQSPGSVSRSGSPLDVAIRGEGYFTVQLPAPEGQPAAQGPIGYTRAGSFRVDAGGTLVTQAGFPVLGGGSLIDVGNATVRIGGDGRVVDEQGNAVGELSVVRFDGSTSLHKQGQSVYLAPAGVAPEEADVSLETESLEQSNVKPVQELATLVILQRAFDASMQTLEASDQLSQRLIEEVSR